MGVLSKLGYNPKKHPDACLFVRNVAAEGRGFEFAMFYNGSERRMAVLLQTGSHLEGMIGFVHGGAVAAILDHTFASCGICASGFVVTANLSVNYKSPIPLGSVVLVETKVEKVEEKKIFLSGCVRSTNARILHAEAT
ncbi:LOW QUALITY PROTEIN: acyl-coenzyme A thioesterase THEM4-like, partial [Pseudonaja textilis]|uniref:LOW QUALITY PROTEIN: acyl-coenzyme A thioesterase THEM4-like n=1 Tax=Pseudonaja textilis TaxID=8673 RepID=UPI000EA8C120